MQISEQARIYSFLNSKGFILRESTKTTLKLARQDSEVVILLGDAALTFYIKTKDESLNYTAKDFHDLMDYLELKVQ